VQNFYLIRHGETDWNVKLKKLQGHTDIPLNDQGLSQASQLPGLVRQLNFTKVISSDLQRAQKTASFLSSQIETTPLLREVNLGIGEGLTWEEVVVKLGPDFREAWSRNHIDNIDMRFPEGESRREVLSRIESVLVNYLNKHPGETIAFVSHGYVIRSLVYSLSKIQDGFFVPNCGVVPFAYHEGRLHYTGPETIELLIQPK
jgi:broad specificity phosphatase PhoE